MSRVHEENRGLICALCCCKIKKEKIIKINQSITKDIQNYLNKDFCPEDPHYPSSVCQGCRQKLYRLTKGQSVNFPSFFDFKGESIMPKTRSQTLCTCIICKKARGLRGIKSKIVKKSSVCPNPIKICVICKGKIGKGIPHKCVESKISENIVTLTANSSKTSQGQITSMLLNSLSDNDKEIKLSTKGRAKILVKKETNHSNKKIMSDDFKILKEKLNLSNNQTYKVAQWIRGTLGMLTL